MIESIDKTRWWQRIWAAFIFFTRLPFWRIYQPPQACYRTVVEHWPLVGWLTGGIMALILWFGSAIMPYSIAVLAAIICRVLITGALHEDGLADFFDGFGGGGNDRERILAIMKDSHIGTYGVLALILYFALLFLTLVNMPPLYAALAVLAGDAYSKLVARCPPAYTYFIYRHHERNLTMGTGHIRSLHRHVFPLLHDAP